MRICLMAHESMAKQSVLSQFLTSEGDNEREDLEDFDTASGSSDSSSRKQDGRSFKTSWLKLFPWCIVTTLNEIYRTIVLI